jgi:hypothetical protein
MFFMSDVVGTCLVYGIKAWTLTSERSYIICNRYHRSWPFQFVSNVPNCDERFCPFVARNILAKFESGVFAHGSTLLEERLTVQNYY